MTEKRKSDGLSLRMLYALTIIGVLVISVLVFFSMQRMDFSFRRLTEAAESQIKLDKAAHELLNASDYLTERVQRFTVEGDRRFLNEYFTEVYETARRESALEKISEDIPASAALTRVLEAMEESQTLMRREYYAMRLVVEAMDYKDYPAVLDDVALTPEDEALNPEEKLNRANEIVLDDEYYDLKDSIRADMQGSLDALEALTRDTEDSAFEAFRRVMLLARVVVALLIALLIVQVVLTIRLGINPLLEAVDRIRADRPIREDGAKEFRYLARAYNALTEKLNQENELLHEISQTDALTGIRNRMALNRDLDQYSHREVTVMLLDLDSFKRINDTYGHEEGDRILQETGKLLAKTFSREHCYRYGGDEFLVIAPDCTEAVFLTRLAELMTKRPVLEKDGVFAQVGYSVGYVHKTQADNEDVRTLFAEADQKMYRIKRRKQYGDTYSHVHTSSPAVSTSLTEKEYSVPEMKALLESLGKEYALARVVDPIECRVLECEPDGNVIRRERCYGIWDADQKCVNCSSALACHTGVHQEKAEEFADKVFHIQSNPVRLRLADGTTCEAVVELATVEPERLGQSRINDREAENRQNRAAKFYARHDSLTKVLNTPAFAEQARELMEKNPCQEWTMVTSNIVGFHLVNTLFGTQKGNSILIRNAEMLQHLAGSGNGLCGRLGGDRFAVLLPRSQYREGLLLQMAQTMREEFSTGFYTFRLHFGVYQVEDCTLAISVMCDRANTALNTVREDLGQVVAAFDETMMRRCLFEQEVISSFETAIDEGQFKMYLQPLAYASGEIFGAEALVRWHKPDGTVVMPGDFIETLENVGLIHRLDSYIWECAIRQLSQWQGTMGERLILSVNMSAKDFYLMDVYGTLTTLLNRYHVPADRLRLEITETALLEDPERSNNIIRILRQEGFLVEIDDFGKGYSSLGLLKNVQVDVLKLDMSLLKEIETHPRCRTLLQSVIEMATNLGMEVVTEGVETEAQLQALVTMGCKHFQGYYFSRPITVESFERRYTGLD